MKDLIGVTNSGYESAVLQISEVSKICPLQLKHHTSTLFAIHIGKCYLCVVFILECDVRSVELSAFAFRNVHTNYWAMQREESPEIMFLESWDMVDPER